MRLLLLAGSFASLISGASPSAMAQGADCGGLKWSIDRERTAFSAGNLPTVVAGGQLSGPGRAAVAHLVKQDAITFEVQPSRRPRNAPAYAGVFSLGSIENAGSYDVTISQEAWIDVVQGGKSLRQTGYTGSKTCPDVRKSVRFDLVRGPASVLISDAAQDQIKLDVLPAP